MMISQSLKSIYHIKSLIGNPEDIVIKYNGKELDDKECLRLYSNNNYAKLDILVKENGGYKNSGLTKLFIYVLSFLTPYYFSPTIYDNAGYLIFRNKDPVLELGNPFKNKNNNNITLPNNKLFDGNVDTFSSINLPNELREKLGNKPFKFYGIKKNDMSIPGNVYLTSNLLFYFSIFSIVFSLFLSNVVCKKPENFLNIGIPLLLITLPSIIGRIITLISNNISINTKYNFLKKIKLFFSNYKFITASSLIFLLSIIIPLIYTFKGLLTGKYWLGYLFAFITFIIIFAIKKIFVFDFSKIKDKYNSFKTNLKNQVQKGGSENDEQSLIHWLSLKIRSFISATDPNPEDIKGIEDFFTNYQNIYTTIYSVLSIFGLFVAYSYSVIPVVNKICKGEQFGKEGNPLTIFVYIILMILLFSIANKLSNFI